MSIEWSPHIERLRADLESKGVGGLDAIRIAVEGEIVTEDRNMKFTINQGVYLLRNKKTRDQYVGASTTLADRLQSHRSEIGHRRHNNPRVAKSFRRHGLAAIEFRILEYVPCPAIEKGSPKTKADIEAQAAELQKLRDRETYWIERLNPNLNICLSNGPIRLEMIPVGI